MLGKLRQVMNQDQKAPLVGTVEIDEAFFGGPRPGVAGRGALGKVLVAGAVEITKRGWGRARLRVIADAKAVTLQQFVEATVTAQGAVVLPLIAGCSIESASAVSPAGASATQETCATTGSDRTTLPAGLAVGIS